MKKLLIVLLTCLTVFALTACQLGADLSALEDMLSDMDTEDLEQLIDVLEGIVEQKQEEDGSGTEPSSDQQQLDQSRVYEDWHTLVGYWNAAGGRFAVPDMEDSHSAVFRYGMWETEFATDYGRVTQLVATAQQELTATVVWSEGGGAEKTVIIDYSGLERDGKIRMKIGNEDWMQYMYAGVTADEALQTHIDNTTGNNPEIDQSRVYEDWHTLVGYWNAAGGRFAVPDMEDSHSAVFRYGMWETEFATDYGRVTQLVATAQQELTATVVWSEGGGAEKTVIIDYSGLERDGKIRMKIGSEDWMQYMYAGATADEALQTHIDNTTGGK